MIILSDGEGSEVSFLASSTATALLAVAAPTVVGELTDRRKISMNKTKITKTLMAVMVGSALLSGSALADESMSQKTQNAADSAGSKIDSSMKKVDGFMDDSAITAKAIEGVKSVKNDLTVKP